MRVKRQSLAGLLDEPKLDISSLIDVCFLLLIFFLVTTTIVKKEQDISMPLPRPGQSVPDFPLVIAVAQNGEILLNPDAYPELIAERGGGRELTKLASRILMMKQSGMKVVVQLRADEAADYQRFIDVMNCLAKTEVERVGLVDVIH